MSDKGFATPERFHPGQTPQSIVSTLERYRGNLERYINTYVPHYNDVDSMLYVNDGVQAASGYSPSNSLDMATKAYVDAYYTDWTTWSPTYSGVTIGNGTASWNYAIINGTVFFHGYVSFGSTTSITGGITWTLPVTAASSVYAFGGPCGDALIVDSGTVIHTARVRVTSSTWFDLSAERTDATYGRYWSVSSTVPMTWTTGDGWAAAGFYKAA